jgi:hypothetical protein
MLHIDIHSFSYKKGGIPKDNSGLIIIWQEVVKTCRSVSDVQEGSTDQFILQSKLLNLSKKNIRKEQR